jgi:hypothetical protein
MPRSTRFNHDGRPKSATHISKSEGHDSHAATAHIRRMRTAAGRNPASDRNLLRGTALECDGKCIDANGAALHAEPHLPVLLDSADGQFLACRAGAKIDRADIFPTCILQAG